MLSVAQLGMEWVDLDRAQVGHLDKAHCLLVLDKKVAAVEMGMKQSPLQLDKEVVEMDMD